jgi:hypothetical protein
MTRKWNAGAESGARKFRTLPIAIEIPMREMPNLDDETRRVHATASNNRRPGIS